MNQHFRRLEFTFYFYFLEVSNMYPTTLAVMNEYDPCNPAYETFCGDGLAGLLVLYDPRSPAFDPRLDTLFSSPYDPFAQKNAVSLPAHATYKCVLRVTQPTPEPCFTSSRPLKVKKSLTRANVPYHRKSRDPSKHYQRSRNPTDSKQPTIRRDCTTYDPRSPVYDPTVDTLINYEPLTTIDQ